MVKAVPVRGSRQIGQVCTFKKKNGAEMKSVLEGDSQGIHRLHLGPPDLLLLDHRPPGRGPPTLRAGVPAGGALVLRGLRGLGGGRRRRCDLGRRLPGAGGAGQAGVEGPHQPVERRVVDQVVQDLVQGPLHLAQPRLPAGERALGQGPDSGRREAGVDAGGGAAQRARLPLEVAGEALQTGRQRETGGLQLLGEGGGQGEGLRDLQGEGGERRNRSAGMHCLLSHLLASSSLTWQSDWTLRLCTCCALSNQCVPHSEISFMTPFNNCCMYQGSNSAVNLRPRLHQGKRKIFPRGLASFTRKRSFYHKTINSKKTPAKVEISENAGYVLWCQRGETGFEVLKRHIMRQEMFNVI